MVLQGFGQTSGTKGAASGGEVVGRWPKPRGRACEEVALRLADLGGREGRQPRPCAEMLRGAGFWPWAESSLASGRRVGRGELGSQAGGQGSRPPSSCPCGPSDISVFGCPTAFATPGDTEASFEIRTPKPGPSSEGDVAQRVHISSCILEDTAIGNSNRMTVSSGTDGPGGAG